MGRWEPDAAGRLQQAAVQLFLERGFEATTVAEIAKQAGLTERTFFRYFTDKREVLFRGSELLHDALAQAVEQAPPGLPGLETVGRAVEALAVFFDGRHEHAAVRARIIAAHPELQERELIKMASLRETLAQALGERGVTQRRAGLLADMGIAVFQNAFTRWVGDGEARPFAEVARELLHELRAAAAGAQEV